MIAILAVKTFSFIIAFLCAWFIIHSICISADGLTDEIFDCDAAVVLGNMVSPEGKPSARLAGRLDKAAELFKRKHFNYIIVSGGIDSSGTDEADAMKRYLIEKGVPEEALICDNLGNNSMLSARNSAAIMKERNFQNLMLISQFYHISRLKLAFSKEGLRHCASASSDHFELRDLYSVFREFFAYYRYLM